jgi:Tol biopolymer transport system component
MSGKLILALATAALIGCGVAGAEKNDYADAPDAVTAITTLLEGGGRVSRLQCDNLIAVDRRGADGYYDLYVIGLDGSIIRSLTAGKTRLPQLHNGQPAWHPSGDYIVFQSQDPYLPFPPDYSDALKRWVSSPGIGVHNNLWLTTADGSRFWQLTRVKRQRGVLHPHFSPDGKKLIWSEKIDAGAGGIGTWVIKLANFRVKSGKPHLKNVRTFRPAGLQLCETHGFSPDGRSIIFSGIENGKSYYDFEVYLMNLKTEALTRLTDNDEWDEHAHFSPDGQWIIWSSSEGIPQNKNIKSIEDLKKLQLDYWIMKPDGSGKQRLTWFNEPSHPHHLAGKTIAADFDWEPDGATLVSYLKRRTGNNRYFDLCVLIGLDLSSLSDYSSSIK